MDGTWFRLVALAVRRLAVFAFAMLSPLVDNLPPAPGSSVVGQVRCFRESGPGPVSKDGCAVFSPDGRWVASSLEDNITIWDASTGNTIREIANKREAH